MSGVAPKTVDAEAGVSVPGVRCPHCAGLMRFPMEEREYAYWDKVETCEHCRYRSHVRIGTVQRSITIGGPTSESTTPVFARNGEMLPGGQLLSIDPLIAPEIVQGLDSPHIPEIPARAVQEAVRCMESSLGRPCAVMCRYTIQAALLDKGISNQSPIRMVNVARQRELLSEVTKSRCQVAIFIGNSGGHPQTDPLKEIGPEDALEALRLTRRVLLELYDPNAIDATS